MLRAVAAEICMIPLGPGGTLGFGIPPTFQVSDGFDQAGRHSALLAAERKMDCSLGSLVTRFAPAIARGSRRMLKVCDWIIRSVRAPRRSVERSSRSTPIPDTRCAGAKKSGLAAWPIWEQAK